VLSAGRRPASDADHDDAVREILATVTADDLWVFGYGSLIWKPAFDFVEQRIGLARGWHRSFCLGWDKWFRGSAERPGVMLALDRGGQCKGIVYRLPPDAIEVNLGKLVRREIRLIPHSFPARWISVATDRGPIRAVTFAIDRKSVGYVGRMSPTEVADILAVAVGQWGSMAEYLYSTVKHLEERGLHDKHLWRLQELVAERIEAATNGG
jgi:glutathione-specific gamma-glutamylcyclotransferase